MFHSKKPSILLFRTSFRRFQLRDFTQRNTAHLWRAQWVDIARPPFQYQWRERWPLLRLKEMTELHSGLSQHLRNGVFGDGSKTLYPCSSHQNSWDLWMFIPLKNGINRYWPIFDHQTWRFNFRNGNFNSKSAEKTHETRVYISIEHWDFTSKYGWDEHGQS